MKGQDFLWIGLGAGALFLITKLGKSTATVGDNIADVTTDVKNAANPWLENLEMIGRLPELTAKLLVGEKSKEDWQNIISSQENIDKVTSDIANKLENQLKARKGSSGKGEKVIDITPKPSSSLVKQLPPVNPQKGFEFAKSPFTGGLYLKKA